MATKTASRPTFQLLKEWPRRLGPQGTGHITLTVLEPSSVRRKVQRTDGSVPGCVSHGWVRFPWCPRLKKTYLESRFQLWKATPLSPMLGGPSTAVVLISICHPLPCRHLFLSSSPSSLVVSREGEIVVWTQSYYLSIEFCWKQASKQTSKYVRGMLPSYTCSSPREVKCLFFLKKTI